MTWKWLVIAGCALASVGCAGQAVSTQRSVLPLRTVRLYETGVGYFERAGTISGASDALPVPASHVDDALKTLLILTDGDAAQIAGVEFDSVMSRGLARSLAALPLGSDRPVSYIDVLESLLGVEVEATPLSGGSVRGKLVEVSDAPAIPLGSPGRVSAASEHDGEPPKALNAPDSENDHYLTLLSEDGSLTRFRASRLQVLRPTDPLLAARLGAAAQALSGRAAQIQRGLRVLATRAVKVRLGYIAETPVWRSTYRLILAPNSSEARVQGWALIHNDTDERWTDINVELVNGRPDSFLFPLSAPRYSRRPLAEPSERLSTVPQLAYKTPDQIWGDNVETGWTGTGQGFGSGHGRLGGSRRSRVPKIRMGAASVSTGESSEISIGDLAEIAQAAGVEVGALFSYRLANRLELRAHGSALVPFTAQDVEARRITWFDRPSGAAAQALRGRSGVRLTNTSAQTLPAGPVSVYEEAGFSGETGMPRLKPKQRAFLRFGVDLDVELKADPDLEFEPVEEPKKVRFERGGLVEHFVQRSEVGYILTNRGAAPRDVYLALDVVKNSKVSGADELDFDLDTSQALAVLKAAPASERKRRLVFEQALQRHTPLPRLTVKTLQALSTNPLLSAGERKVLSEAVVLLEAVDQAQTAISDGNKQRERLDGDLERMREHLKALGDKSGAPAGANPIVARLLELEDRLSKQRRLLEILTKDLDDRRAAVQEKLETLGEDTPPASAATGAVPVPKP